MNFFEKIFSQEVKLNPDLPAIITRHNLLSYSELKEKAISASEFLSGKQINKNEPVAILSDNNPDFIILTLALWLIDAIPVPINTKLRSGEIQQLLEIAGCKKIFIHKSCGNDPQLTSIDKLNFPSESTAATGNGYPPKLDLENTAVIIFTSGSSGIPKGVMLSFSNLVRSAEIGNLVLQQSEKDRWLASLPFYHIGGFSIITRAFLYEAALIIPESLGTKDLKFSFENQNPTLASLVSTQLKRLIELKTNPGKELKNLLLGGGFVNNDLVKTAINNGWKISKVYGSSETSSFVTMIGGKEVFQKMDSSGKILPPNEIYILGESGQKLPAGKSGEIVVKSDSVMKGYINNEKETSNKLKEGMYFSGDIGYLDEEGYLFVEARRNDLIISGGENINPLEVQKAILENPDIKDCYVFGLEDKTWGHIVTAVVVKSNDTNIILKEYLGSKIAGYKIPKKIIYVDQIPKTSLGKIEKEKVRDLFN